VVGECSHDTSNTRAKPKVMKVHLYLVPEPHQFLGKRGH